MAAGSDLPIDRGWAWMITFACFGIFGFLTGSQKSRGIILVELQELYPNASTTLLIWVLSINFVTDRVLGPVNGMILARTSNRTLSMIGSCIMTASLIGFAYSPSIECMFVAYALFGWGTGMNSLSCMTAYQPYFDKKKALSLGITGSGSGFGTLYLSAVLRALFDNFPFSGAILLYAGFALQTLVLACLLRPFSFYDTNEKNKNDSSQKTRKPLAEQSRNPAVEELKECEELRQRSLSVSERRVNTPLVEKGANEFKSIPSNLHAIPANSRQRQHKHGYSNFELFALSTEDISRTVLVLEQEDEKVQSAENPEKNTDDASLNWKLVYNPRCILLGLSILLHITGMMSAYTCIPPLGVQTGVSKQVVSILLAAGGTIETPMRTLNGLLADRKLVTAYNQLSLYMIITGITAFLCATISGTAGIAVMLVGLSSTGTSVFTLLPIACGELFGGKNVRSGMAILFVYQGLAIIVASFSSGALYEHTGRWETVYYYISASQISGGIVMLSTAGIAYCINKQRHVKNVVVVAQ